MSRGRIAQPAYGFHVSGQARVRLGDEVYYLGRHGSPESYARYYALLAEYNANGREAPSKDRGSVIAENRQSESAILVKHVTADFRHRELARHDHNPATQGKYQNLCDLLDEYHGDEPVDEFGPRKLESLRDRMVNHGIGKNPKPNSRRYANAQIGRIIEIIRHAVGRELIGPERVVALQALPHLKRGQARDNPKRCGVALDVIAATLNHLTPTAVAMVKIQLATAMRPSELFRMTPSMIDRDGPVWFYRPTNHKTATHGKRRAVPIVNDARDALTPFLDRPTDELCFLTELGTPWNKDAYRIAVRRAAKAAKVDHWTPYGLRHTALQAMRDTAGPEAAQAMAGHSRLSTTEIYAKASEAKAILAAHAAPSLGGAK